MKGKSLICTIKTMRFLAAFFLFAEEVLPKKTENKAPCISFLATKQSFMLTHGLMKSRKLQVCPQIRNRSASNLSVLDFDMMHLPQPSNSSSCTHFKPDKLFIHLPTARRSATASFSLHTRYEWRLSRGARVSASSSSLSYDSSEPLDQSWQQGYLQKPPKTTCKQYNIIKKMSIFELQFPDIFISPPISNVVLLWTLVGRGGRLVSTSALAWKKMFKHNMRIEPPQKNLSSLS